jgi:hypothetical protein
MVKEVIIQKKDKYNELLPRIPSLDKNKQDVEYHTEKVYSVNKWILYLEYIFLNHP